MVHRPRPYWHVDAKLLSAMLMIPLMTATLLLMVMVQISSEQNAVPVMTTLMAAMFSPAGLDDPHDIDEVRRQMREQNLERFTPIPGLKAGVTRADLEGMTPRELRISIFRQVVEPLYREGQAGVRLIASDPAMAAQIEKDLGPLGVVNATLHQTLRRALAYALAACAVLLVLVMLFSSGFGRLLTPGIVLLVSTPPGWLLYLALRGSGDGSEPPAHPSAGGSVFDMIGGYVAPAIAPLVESTYSRATLTALLLIAISILGSLSLAIARAVRARRSARPAA